MVEAMVVRKAVMLVHVKAVQKVGKMAVLTVGTRVE